MRVSGIILFACLTGCKIAPSNHYEVDINPAFDDRHKELIVQAAQKWVDMVDDPLQLTFDVKISECQNGDNVICVFPSTSAVLNAMSKANGHADKDVWGITIYSGEDYMKRRRQIYLAMDVLQDDGKFYRTVAHEEGHSIELPHLGYNTIMCANSSCQAQDITCEDVNAFLSLRDTFTRDCVVKVGATP